MKTAGPHTPSIGQTQPTLTALVIALSTTAGGSIAFPNLALTLLDPLDIVLVGTIAALLSALLPAQRATRDDPILALHAEQPEAAGMRRTRRIIVLTPVALTSNCNTFHRMYDDS